ncbi:MAG: hypothetical protein P0119_01230 [Nitrospira sp.]|nr:hypothetical protein [Nitrospira sp.]
MKQTCIFLLFSRWRAAWLTALTLLLPLPVCATDEAAEPSLELSGLIRELDAANPEVKAACQR